MPAPGSFIFSPEARRLMPGRTSSLKEWRPTRTRRAVRLRAPLPSARTRERRGREAARGKITRDENAPGRPVIAVDLTDRAAFQPPPIDRPVVRLRSGDGAPSDPGLV